MMVKKAGNLQQITVIILPPPQVAATEPKGHDNIFLLTSGYWIIGFGCWTMASGTFATYWIICTFSKFLLDNYWMSMLGYTDSRQEHVTSLTT